MKTRISPVRALATLATLTATLFAGGCDIEDAELHEEMEALEQEELDDAEFRAFYDLEVRHGPHKVKITNTTGNKWKIKWMCQEFDDDGNFLGHVKIDADQFPASTGTTRETNMDTDRCPSGKWRVYLYVKDGGDWEPVTPSGEESVCGDGNWSCGYLHDGMMRYYIPNTHFNGNDKICLKAWWALGSFWVDKVGC